MMSMVTLTTENGNCKKNLDKLLIVSAPSLWGVILNNTKACWGKTHPGGDAKPGLFACETSS